MDSDVVTGSPTVWLVALAAALLAGLGAALLAIVRGRRRSRAALQEVLSRTEELAREVEDLRRVSRPVERASVPYVITKAGDAPASLPASPDGHIDGRLFADLVLRESVVKAAAVAHGVRRALAPETRHRIRFEMGREVKRARRQRRADLREARRRLHAEQRAHQPLPEQGAA